MDYRQNKQEIIWTLRKHNKGQKTKEYETSFIENPYACENSPMITPAYRGTTNGTAGFKRKHNSRTEMNRPSPPPSPLPSPEDPWKPQLSIFYREDEKHFADKVKFAHNYVTRLSNFVTKMEKERVMEDEWRTLAEVVNRFFMLVTVVGFSVTAVLFYFLTSTQE